MSDATGRARFSRPRLRDLLRRRAELARRTRAFFDARDVLEVDTPTLARGVIVDAHIDPVECLPDSRGARFLLPSPEVPMKRLLAAGSGAIYRLGPAFREGEHGRLHRTEFTMLEWYRPGLPMRDLVDEVGELMRALLGTETWEVREHAEVFAAALHVDSHSASIDELRALAARRGAAPDGDSSGMTRADWLDLLWSRCVEPTLDPETATFVHGWPACQAALAELTDDDPPRALRFELVLGGTELCNGYQELRDPAEHRRRFAAENARRRQLGKPALPTDELLLDALERGLPVCSGVAVGFDRVVMLACGTGALGDVLPLG